MYPIHRKSYFNVHHKDWSTYSSETHRPDELCYNSNSSTEIVDFLAGIHDCYSHSPTLLCLALSLDPIICSMLAFPSSRTSFVSVSNHFPSNLKGVATFLYLTYD